VAGSDFSLIHNLGPAATDALKASEKIDHFGFNLVWEALKSIGFCDEELASIRNTCLGILYLGGMRLGSEVSASLASVLLNIPLEELPLEDAPLLCYQLYSDLYETVFERACANLELAVSANDDETVKLISIVIDSYEQSKDITDYERFIVCCVAEKDEIKKDQSSIDQLVQLVISPKLYARGVLLRRFSEYFQVCPASLKGLESDCEAYISLNELEWEALQYLEIEETVKVFMNDCTGLDCELINYIIKHFQSLASRSIVKPDLSSQIDKLMCVMEHIKVDSECNALLQTPELNLSDAIFLLKKHSSFTSTPILSLRAKLRATLLREKTELKDLRVFEMVSTSLSLDELSLIAPNDDELKDVVDYFLRSWMMQQKHPGHLEREQKRKQSQSELGSLVTSKDEIKKRQGTYSYVHTLALAQEFNWREMGPAKHASNTLLTSAAEARSSARRAIFTSSRMARPVFAKLTSSVTPARLQRSKQSGSDKEQLLTCFDNLLRRFMQETNDAHGEMFSNKAWADFFNTFLKSECSSDENVFIALVCRARDEILVSPMDDDGENEEMKDHTSRRARAVSILALILTVKGPVPILIAPHLVCWINREGFAPEADKLMRDLVFGTMSTSIALDNLTAETIGKIRKPFAEAYKQPHQSVSVTLTVEAPALQTVAVPTVIKVEASTTAVVEPDLEEIELAKSVVVVSERERYEQEKRARTKRREVLWREKYVNCVVLYDYQDPDGDEMYLTVSQGEILWIPIKPEGGKKSALSHSKEWIWVVRFTGEDQADKNNQGYIPFKFVGFPGYEEQQ